MGAELLPSSIVKAVQTLPNEFFSNHSIVLFGTENEKIPNSPHITFVSCPDVVGMDENPLQTIREKKPSSLLIGISALKEGKIAAFISCANTGALVSLARSELEAISNTVSKPALACTIPTKTGDVLMLDVGANVEVTAEMLVQFAKLGAEYWQSLYGAKPRVALLNVGVEPIKGTQELKAAVKELPSELYTFVGNKEPYDVFTNQADVFVTDGFSGNLFIKTSEAVLRSRGIAYEESYAILLGLKQHVIKCHGASSERAIQKAILSSL
ncbi:MAG: hypothetical protein JSR37_03185 [Verrucomicrobia bacterium]|nr:hypothetical protein [Verrucomicrobiota bacterium]